MARSTAVKAMLILAVAVGAAAVLGTISFQQAKRDSAVAAMRLMISPFDRVESVERIDRDRPAVWINDTIVGMVDAIARFREAADSPRQTGPEPDGFLAVAGDPASRVLFIAEVVSNAAPREIRSWGRRIAVVEDTSPIRIRLITTETANGREKIGYLLLRDLNLYFAAYHDST